MPTTDYFEALILDYAIRQEAFSISNWYIGLWTADPTSAGLLSGESTASDYQRKPVSWSSLNQNATQIDWAPATSSWGTITYLALTDNATKNTGTVLAYGPTAQSYVVGIGVPLTITPNGLLLTIA
jgi:hypothetical protein